MAGLYIHIPFCERKCSYCAFYSFPKPWKNVDGFFQTLAAEIENLKSLYPDFLPDTIFIGGGTPTALDVQTLGKFIPTLRRFSPIEFSCEANPGTVDPWKLDLLIKNGVNRLSIGVQSFDSRSLETLGRIHSAEQAESAFRLARAAGFKNMGLDLMFGIPGQTIKNLEADLDRALALEPEHISVYNLMYEEGTPLTAINPEKLDENLERELYDLIRRRLTDEKFIHYEISNFARSGFECRHNLLYWNGGEYIGCGPAAHSHWKGVRWANVADLDDYLTMQGAQPTPSCEHPSRGGECDDRSKSPLLGGVPERQGGAGWPRREFEETLDSEAKERETLVMGLRQLAGVEVSDSLWGELQESFQTLEKAGLLKIDGRRIRLSEEALFVSDSVFTELV